MAADSLSILFSLPGGRLELPLAQLDRWAKHLTWCYRMLGVQPGVSLGVVDFGASPVSFLGSKHLTPGLEQGVAERLPATTICLDASWERVALVPSVLAQFPIDVLVIRNEVKPLLESVCRDARVDLERLTLIDAVGFGSRGWGPLSPGWRRLLVVEATMLLAPECPACGALHISPRQYKVDAGARSVTALGTSWTQVLPGPFGLQAPGCPRGTEDWLVRPPGEDTR